MDRKEQIVEILKEYINTDKCKKAAPQIGRDAWLDCIEALEKQIPKDYMIELYSNGFFKRNICPKCEDIRGLIKESGFCPWCGQAIKWE